MVSVYVAGWLDRCARLQLSPVRRPSGSFYSLLLFHRWSGAARQGRQAPLIPCIPAMPAAYSRASPPRGVLFGPQKAPSRPEPTEPIWMPLAERMGAAPQRLRQASAQVHVVHLFGKEGILKYLSSAYYDMISLVQHGKLLLHLSFHYILTHIYISCIYSTAFDVVKLSQCSSQHSL